MLDDAACFRLRLQPLTDSWQVKHQEKLSTLRINPYRRKTNGSKERILELEFAPDAIDRNWLLIALTSCYTILFLQPALGAVGGGGG